MSFLQKFQWSFYTISLLYSWAPIHFSLTCPLDICFLFRLPPADGNPLAVLTRGVSFFFVVSLCSPIVSDHRGQIQIPKNLCSQPQGPELASLETGLRLGCGVQFPQPLTIFGWKSVVTVPLPPDRETLSIHFYFYNHTELSAGLEAELSTLVSTLPPFPSLAFSPNHLPLFWGSQRK